MRSSPRSLGYFIHSAIPFQLPVHVNWGLPKGWKCNTQHAYNVLAESRPAYGPLEAVRILMFLC